MVVASPGVVRRLAAILVADAVGYSRLMAADELGTHIQFRSHINDLVGPEITEHRGRLVKTTGDGFLAEFPSVVDAVGCAVELQRDLREWNAGIPDSRRMAYRMGINLGEVIVEQDDIYGEDVNLAARLEALAVPGGICLSAEVYRGVRNKIDCEFQDLGNHRVKNIPDPVRVYQVVDELSGQVDSDEPETAEEPADDDAVPSAETPLKLRDRPSIVVMPFTNLSSDHERDYFCDGLTEDITTDLSKFSNVYVVASSTAFTYKGKRVTPQEISRELGVRYFLVGSVQLSSDRVRVNAQLIDATSGFHLWAERFDRDYEDIFALQDEMIQMIVTALAVKVNKSELERAMEKETDNLSAYYAFLRGAYLWKSNLDRSNESEEGFKESRRWLEKSAELDPEFARAWGWLSYVHMTSWLEGWSGDEAVALAEDYALRAVELGPADYDNHYALAFVYAKTRRFEQALGAYRTALNFNQNDPDVVVEMAETLSQVGRHRDCIEQVRRAMYINPNFPEWYHWIAGFAYYHAGDYENALTELGKMLRPNNKVWLIIAASHAQMAEARKRDHDDGAADSEMKQARQAIKRFLARRPDWTIEKERRAEAFLRSEDESHWLDGLRLAGLPEGEA